MKVRVAITLLAMTSFAIGWQTPAQAIGCISGGVAGAVAGHMAHHGVLGAVGGCIAGHEYNKHQKAAAQAQRAGTSQPQPMNGAPNYGTDRQN